MQIQAVPLFTEIAVITINAAVHDNRNATGLVPGGSVRIDDGFLEPERLGPQCQAFINHSVYEFGTAERVNKV